MNCQYLQKCTKKIQNIFNRYYWSLFSRFTERNREWISKVIASFTSLSAVFPFNLRLIKFEAQRCKNSNLKNPLKFKFSKTVNIKLSETKSKRQLNSI